MTIVLYKDALSGSVVPIAAKLIHVKVDWSSLHFSQKFFLWSKHRFSYINVRQVPRIWRCLKPRTADISGG